MELDDLLKCPLCYDFFKLPVLLPSCSHNFCYGCVSGDVAVKECPVCFEKVLDADTPIRNQILDDLIRVSQSETTGQADTSSADESECSTVIYEFEDAGDVSQSSQDESMNTQDESHTENVTCPICWSLIPHRMINYHLHDCLKVQTDTAEKTLEETVRRRLTSKQKLKPLPKKEYELMSHEQLQARLGEFYLPTDGKREVLLKRLQIYTEVYKTTMKSDVSMIVSRIEKEKGKANLDENFKRSQADVGKKTRKSVSNIDVIEPESRTRTAREGNGTPKNNATSAGKAKTVSDADSDDSCDVAEVSGRVEKKIKKRRKSKFWTYEPVLLDSSNAIGDDSNVNIEKQGALVGEGSIDSECDSGADATPRTPGGRNLRVAESDAPNVNLETQNGLSIGGFIDSDANTDSDAIHRKRRRSLRTTVPPRESDIVANSDSESSGSSRFTAIKERAKRATAKKVEETLPEIPREGKTFGNQQGTSMSTNVPTTNRGRTRPLTDVESDGPGRRSLSSHPLVQLTSRSDSKRSKDRRSLSASSFMASNSLPEDMNLKSPRSSSEGRVHESDSDATSKNRKRTSKFWTYETVPVKDNEDSPVILDAGGKRPTRRSCVKSDATFSDEQQLGQLDEGKKKKDLEEHKNSNNVSSSRTTVNDLDLKSPRSRSEGRLKDKQVQLKNSKTPKRHSVTKDNSKICKSDKKTNTITDTATDVDNSSDNEHSGVKMGKVKSKFWSYELVPGEVLSPVVPTATSDFEETRRRTRRSLSATVTDISSNEEYIRSPRSRSRGRSNDHENLKKKKVAAQERKDSCRSHSTADLDLMGRCQAGSSRANSSTRSLIAADLAEDQNTDVLSPYASRRRGTINKDGMTAFFDAEDKSRSNRSRSSTGIAETQNTDLLSQNISRRGRRSKNNDELIAYSEAEETRRSNRSRSSTGITENQIVDLLSPSSAGRTTELACSGTENRRSSHRSRSTTYIVEKSLDENFQSPISNSGRRKGETKFWTYVPVPIAVVSDSEVASRGTRRSRTLEMSDVFASDTETEKRDTRRSRSALVSNVTVADVETGKSGTRRSSRDATVPATETDKTGARRSNCARVSNVIVADVETDESATRRPSRVKMSDITASNTETEKREARGSRRAHVSNVIVADVETDKRATRRPSRAKMPDITASAKETEKTYTSRSNSPQVSSINVTDAETDATVSDTESEKRGTKRSCGAKLSDAVVSDTQSEERGTRRSRGAKVSDNPDSVMSQSPSHVEENLKVNKKCKSKYWSYEIVAPEAGSAVELDNVGDKREKRKACVTIGRGASKSDGERATRSDGKVSLKLNVLKKLKRPISESKRHRGRVLAPERRSPSVHSPSSVRSRSSAHRRSNSPVASLFSQSRKELLFESRRLLKNSEEAVPSVSGKGTNVADSVRPEKTECNYAEGVGSTSTASDYSQVQIAPVVNMQSTEVLGTVLTPGRKRKRSLSSSPAPVNSLLARQSNKRQKTRCNGVKNRLNMSAGLCKGQGSSDDVYDFDSSEETVPDILTSPQDSTSKQKLAISTMPTPKLGTTEQSKDSVSCGSSCQKDSTRFLAPFMSPTTSTSSALSVKPLTPLIAGIFCNSPAFGGVKFADDEDHVDGFGYVDDSSSEVDSGDDLLGSISQRINNFDVEGDDQSDVNHNIPNIAVEKLWPALSRLPKDQEQPSSCSDTAESPQQKPVENIHLVPESPVIHSLGGHSYRKRTPAEQESIQQSVIKAKKRL